MPKVYIPQEPTRKDPETGRLVSMMNFKRAAQFGETVVCMPSGPVVLSAVPTVQTLRDKLRDFCDEDYLIAVGDPTLIAVGAMVAADYNRGRVALLKYDKEARAYLKVEININHRKED